MTVLNQFQCDLCFNITNYGSTMTFLVPNVKEGAKDYIYDCRKSFCQLRSEQYDGYIIKHVCKGCMDSVSTLNGFGEDVKQANKKSTK